jgi:hypothetical protein
MVFQEASLAVRPGFGHSHACQDEVFAVRLSAGGHPAANDQVWYLIGNSPAPAAKRTRAIQVCCSRLFGVGLLLG